MKKPTNTITFLCLKRRKKQLIRLYRPSHWSPTGGGKLAVMQGYKSLPLSLLSKSIKKAKKPLRRKDIFLPPVFSIIKNPKASIKTILDLASARSQKLRELHFNHQVINKLDLAAESLLDFVAMELKEEFRSKKFNVPAAQLQTSKMKFLIAGDLPKDKSLNRYLRAVGIIKNLDIKDKFLTLEEEKGLRIFKMRSKRIWMSTHLGEVDFKSKAIKDFVEHINDCLKDHKTKLTRDMRKRLAKYTGEILNNVEDHSGYDEMYIVGYLDNQDESHFCEIAIFNFGNTISETFNNMPADSYTREEIGPYIEKHRKSKYFSSSWLEEDLLTLIALQGHISSKNHDRNQDRGQGTVDLIEFFQGIHRECVNDNMSTQAEMAILSGSTHVLFDGTYLMKPDASGRKVIAFNKTNDLGQMPDKAYISNLDDVHFPGTVISIRFPMRTQNIEEIVSQ